MNTIAPTTSHNFNVSRGAAIVMVVAAHFFRGLGLWPAVTVGLFIFGFSSGFFTSARYHDTFQYRRFWLRKLVRLGPDILVIDAFLLVLFLVRGRSGIWTWQTIVNLVGMTGFLNWFWIPNISPFGAGAWFLTLLLLFYAAYPLIRQAVRSRRGALALGALSLALCVLCQYLLPMGHMLWLTAWSFIFGVVVQRTDLSIPTRISGSLVVLLTALVIVLNTTLSFKGLNFFLLIAVSVLTVIWLKSAKLPKRCFFPLRLVSGCLLEVYLLHAYLFVKGLGHLGVDALVTFACIVSASWLLRLTARRLEIYLSRACSAGMAPTRPNHDSRDLA